MEPLLKRLTQKGSPFELQDAVIKGIPCKIFPHGSKTLQNVFLKAASYKNKEFIIYNDVRFSFELVIERAKRLAIVFQEQYGVAKGDRVALVMDNSPEWVITFIAIFFAGAAAVTIHADTEKQAALKALEITNCSLIISDGRNISKFDNKDIEYTVVLFTNNNSGEFQSKVREKNHNLNLSFVDLPQVPDKDTTRCNNEIQKPSPDDEALISFTSGTTGTPKGVVLSHRNMSTGLMNMMLGGYIMSYRAPKMGTGKQVNISNMQPCSLLLSPFSHIGGYSQIMLMCYLGGKIVLMKKWDTNKASILINKEKVKSLNGATPKMIRELLHANRSGDKLKTLTNLNIHGAALNQCFLREVIDEFPSMSIGTGYGMTETCGSIATVSGTELLKTPDSIGPILPSVHVKVINDEGEELPQEKLGEICVQGAMIMEGYCADSNNTSAVLEDGWLKTGDLGYLDSNGNLYVKDRLKDIIIYGNHHISADELERAASEHPMIDEAIVFGVPSSEECEKIVLAVLPNNTRQIDEESLKHELFSRINKYSDKIKITFVKSLPRTVSGKVNRNELRQQITLV